MNKPSTYGQNLGETIKDFLHYGLDNVEGTTKGLVKGAVSIPDMLGDLLAGGTDLVTGIGSGLTGGALKATNFSDSKGPMDYIGEKVNEASDKVNIINSKWGQSGVGKSLLDLNEMLSEFAIPGGGLLKGFKALKNSDKLKALIAKLKSKKADNIVDTTKKSTKGKTKKSTKGKTNTEQLTTQDLTPEQIAKIPMSLKKKLGIGAGTVVGGTLLLDALTDDEINELDNAINSDPVADYEIGDTVNTDTDKRKEEMLSMDIEKKKLLEKTLPAQYLAKEGLNWNQSRDELDSMLNKAVNLDRVGKVGSAERNIAITNLLTIIKQNNPDLFNTIKKALQTKEIEDVEIVI